MTFAEVYQQLWPYAFEQEADLPLLKERFSIWKDTVKDLVNYFKLQQTLEKSISKEHHKLHKALESNSNKLGCNSSIVFKPWELYASQMAISTENSDQQIEHLVIKRLEVLKLELKRKVDSFNQTLGVLQKNIYQVRRKTASLIEDHENQKVSLQQSKDAVPNPIRSSIDPWMNERILNRQLMKMIDEENMFQNSMVELFEEMSALDCHVVEELKRIFEEFALIKNSQWASMQAQVSTAVSSGSMVESGNFFETFASIHSFNDKRLWKTERSLADFPFKIKEIEMIKQGILYKPSKLGLFNTWTPVQCSVTETGFFHGFHLSKSRHRELFHYYQRTDVDTISRVPSISQSTPNRAPSLKRKDTLGSMYNTLMKIEQSDPKDFLMDGKGHHSFSISLSQPRISIEILPTKSNLFIFEIVILQRRTKSFLSPFMKHKSGDIVTRYEFKTSTERELIEWVACLQQQIQNLAPTGPPEPLFKSPQQIEENVGALIKDQTLNRSFETELLDTRNIDTDKRYSSHLTIEPTNETVPDESGGEAATIEKSYLQSDRNQTQVML